MSVVIRTATSADQDQCLAFLSALRSEPVQPGWASVFEALQVLAEMVLNGKSLRDLCAGMSKFPQHMINVPVSGHVELESSADIKQAVQRAEVRMAGRGRVLLRPSGTEPVVRVMVEGDNESLVLEQATALAETVSRALGN